MMSSLIQEKLASTSVRRFLDIKKCIQEKTDTVFPKDRKSCFRLYSQVVDGIATEAAKLQFDNVILQMRLLLHPCLRVVQLSKSSNDKCFSIMSNTLSVLKCRVISTDSSKNRQSISQFMSLMGAITNRFGPCFDSLEKSILDVLVVLKAFLWVDGVVSSSAAQCLWTLCSVNHEWNPPSNLAKEQFRRDLETLLQNIPRACSFQTQVLLLESASMLLKCPTIKDLFKDVPVTIQHLLRTDDQRDPSKNIHQYLLKLNEEAHCITSLETQDIAVISTTGRKILFADAAWLHVGVDTITARAKNGFLLIPTTAISAAKKENGRLQIALKQAIATMDILPMINDPFGEMFSNKLDFQVSEEWGSRILDLIMKRIRSSSDLMEPYFARADSKAVANEILQCHANSNNNNSRLDKDKIINKEQRVPLRKRAKTQQKSDKEKKELPHESTLSPTLEGVKNSHEWNFVTTELDATRPTLAKSGTSRMKIPSGMGQRIPVAQSSKKHPTQCEKKSLLQKQHAHSDESQKKQSNLEESDVSLDFTRSNLINSVTTKVKKTPVVGQRNPSAQKSKKHPTRCTKDNLRQQQHAHSEELDSSLNNMRYSNTKEETVIADFNPVHTPKQNRDDLGHIEIDKRSPLSKYGNELEADPLSPLTGDIWQNDLEDNAYNETNINSGKSGAAKKSQNSHMDLFSQLQTLINEILEHNERIKRDKVRGTKTLTMEAFQECILIAEQSLAENNDTKAWTHFIGYKEDFMITEKTLHASQEHIDSAMQTCTNCLAHLKSCTEEYSIELEKTEPILKQKHRIQLKQLHQLSSRRSKLFSEKINEIEGKYNSDDWMAIRSMLSRI